MEQLSSQELLNKSGPTNRQSIVDPSKGTLTAWLIIFGLMSFAIFASNLATIVTFLINRHLRRHSVYCLINLATADMIHGLCSIFWYFLYLDHLGLDILSIKLRHRGMNLAAGLVNTSTLVLSLVSLLLVSLDRVFATFFPFTHRSTTSKTYAKVFVLTWCLALLLSAIPSLVVEWNIYGHDIWFENLDFLCILALVTIMLAYTAIFVKIRQQNNLHQRHRQASIQRTQKQEKQLAMTLFIATVLSLMTWLPFIINHEFELSSSLPPGPVQHNFELLTELIQLTNSLINPIVYIFRMKEFREALLQLLFKCSRVRQRIYPSCNHHGHATLSIQKLSPKHTVQELAIIPRVEQETTGPT